MAKAQNTTIATINADERGFVTRKQCRSQMREALKGLGLTCGLMESDGGKRYTATIANSNVTVTAERKVGASVTATASKKQLTALGEMTRMASMSTAAERKEAKAERKEAKAERKQAREIAAAVENEPDIPVSELDVFTNLSMDEQGRLTSAHPRKGGLSAGAIRAMLEADGYEITPGLRKSDLVEMLMSIVSLGGVVAPVAEKPVAKAKAKAKTVATKVLKFEQGAASTEIVF